MDADHAKEAQSSFERRERIVRVLGSIAALVAIGSLWSVTDWTVRHGPAEIGSIDWRFVIVAMWVLLPPVWFWCEYSFVFNESDRRDEPLMRRRKDAQEVASRVWLAVVAVLVLLTFGKAP